MNFTVVDFHESLLSCDFDSKHIAKVVYAWGEEEEPWNGGFCFIGFDMYHYRIIRYEDSSCLLEKSDRAFTPPTDDYDYFPADIQRWLDEGASEGELLSF